MDENKKPLKSNLETGTIKKVSRQFDQYSDEENSTENIKKKKKANMEFCATAVSCDYKSQEFLKKIECN